MHKAIALGEHTQPHAAVPIYWFQRFTLADFMGGLENVEPALRDLVSRYPARVMFRCAAAYVDARLGRLEQARQALDALVRTEYSLLGVDQEWLYGMSLLAEVAALSRSTSSAASLYRALAPWAEFNVADLAEGVRGSVSRYLGLLATTAGRHKQAAAYFDQAIASNARMGALPWLAHTQRDYTQLLLTRSEPGDRDRALELIGDAILTYKRVGMDPWTAEAAEIERALKSAPAANG
jgi:tetratricopeptide (TPR) repeat protein